MSTLLVRADADATIGLGHVMRCLALAQAWGERGGKSVFLGSAHTAFPGERLAAEGIAERRLSVPPGTRQDAEQTVAAARQLGAAWIVIDGYQFDAEYQQYLKSSGCKLLAIDDYGHAGRYPADIVLNQNFAAQPGWYTHREAYTRLLLGTQYVLLRREFWTWGAWERRVAPVASKLLVTMGGADPHNIAGRVLEALATVPADGLEITVVAGAANPHQEQLRQAARHLPHQVRFEAQVSDMATLMARAEAGISAAGSTIWELMLMQVPFCSLILAENQRPAAEALAREGLGCIMETSRIASQAMCESILRVLHDAAWRQDWARRARTLVDGQGVTRVLAAMDAC